ncbi:hypothetical protein BDR26DRAFT_866041 [Obelidium mucronatum]|nr:hypothetical protein BDR26DRAFT_866041 [Obelidium mucronatum]
METIREELQALESIWHNPPHSEFSWTEKVPQKEFDPLVVAHAVFTKANAATQPLSQFIVVVSFVVSARYPISIDHDALKVSVESSDKSLTVGQLATLQTCANQAVQTSVSGEAILFNIGDAVRQSFLAITSATPQSTSASLSPIIPLMTSLQNMKEDPFVITNGMRTHLSSVSLQAVLQAAQAHAEATCMKEKLGSILHVHPIASRRLLDNFLTKHTELMNTISNPVWGPTFAFHSTCDKDFIPSIIDNGLLGAGDYTTDGELIPMLHGAIYGNGIYASPSFAFADQYGFQDYMENKQIIMCLVAPGRAKPIQQPVLFSKEWETHYIQVANQPIETGFDSHILHKKQIVVRESSQILPLLLITYESNHPIGFAQKTAAVNSRMLKALANAESYMEKELESIEMHPLVSFSESAEKYFTLTIPSTISMYQPFQRKKTHVKTHLILLIDRSKSMRKRAYTKLVLPACSLLTKKVGAARTDAIFFGSTVTTFPNIKNGFFESDKAVGMELENGTDIMGAYKAAVEIALREEEAAQRDFENSVSLEAEKKVDAVKAQDLVDKELFDRLNKYKKEKRIQDGTGFVEMSEEEIERRDFHVKASEVRAQMKAAGRESIYAFVLITDGEDTFTDEDGVDIVLTKYNKMINGAGLNLNTLFKIIGVGKNSSTRIGLKAHLATQTLHQSAHVSPVWYCQKVHEIPVIAANLGSKISEALGFISIEAPSLHILNGFIKNWTSTPISRICSTLSTKSNNTKTILFKGTPPPALIIDGCPVRIKLSANSSPDVNSVLILLRELLLDVKVAVVTRNNYKQPTDALLKLVQEFRSAQLGTSEFASMNGSDRMKLMKEKRGLLMDLDGIINELRVDLAVVETQLSHEDAAKWLAPIKSMKFATSIVRRSASAADDATLRDDVAKVVEWCQTNTTVAVSGPTSKQSGMTAISHLKDISLLETKKMTVSDFLYSCGFPGIGIQVVRSQSAIVNPWNLVVKYVSPEFGDSASAMCMLHAGIVWNDSAGHQIEDVLLVSNPFDDRPFRIFSSLSIFKAYTSIVFTRNPDLYLPQQRIALLSISLVRAIEQLYQKHDQKGSSQLVDMASSNNTGSIENIFNIIFTLRKFKHNSWKAFLARLQQPNPSKYLTESTANDDAVGVEEQDGVLSIAQVLVALCGFACFETSPSEKKKSILHSGNESQLSEAALALLGESVSRGCRIKIKSADATNPKKYREFIREALSISLEQVSGLDGTVPIQSSSVWVASGKKYSGRFFKSEKWRTNASPQGVAACLAFSRWCAGFWTGKTETLEDVLSNQEERAALFDGVKQSVEQDDGMHGFLTLYSEDLVSDDTGTSLASKDLLQIALYLQGLRYHESKSRRVGLKSLTDPFTVISHILEEEKNEIYKDWFAQKQREVNALGRAKAHQMLVELKLKQQEQFLHVHQDKMPRIFTAGEAADDQLELMPGGLLKHHCTNEDCSEYMVNQATDNDRIHNRRNGLYRHLKWFFIPDKRYIPNFHVLLMHFKAIHEKKGVDKESMCEKLCESFKTNDTTKLIVRRLGDAHLADIVGKTLSAM